MKIDIKNIKIGLIIFFAIVLLIYFILLLYNINSNFRKIQDAEKKLEELDKSIRLEIRNQERIEKSGKDFLKTAYFDKKEKFYENYIRSLFSKYGIKINIYQSSMNEKEAAELDVTFDSDAFKFFRLLKDIEEGEKIIVIKNLSINKSAIPVLKVNMKLDGFYKE